MIINGVVAANIKFHHGLVIQKFAGTAGTFIWNLHSSYKALNQLSYPLTLCETS